MKLGDFMVDEPLDEYNVFKYKKVKEKIPEPMTRKELLKKVYYTCDKLVDKKYSFLSKFIKKLNLKSNMDDFISERENFLDIYSIDIMATKHNVKLLSNGKSESIYDFDDYVLEVVNNFTKDLNNEIGKLGPYKITSEGDNGRGSYSLTIGIHVSSEYNSRIVNRKTGEELKESTGELLEFGFYNKKANGYLVSADSNLDSSKFDRDIKKLYGNNIGYAFKNFIEMKIYNKNRPSFGATIFVNSDFFKKYGSKIVYIYEIKNGEIRLKDKGTIIELCRKYEVVLLDNTTYDPVIGYSSKSEKDIKAVFNIVKDLISNELNKYEDYEKYIEWKPLKITGTYSVICEIDVDGYSKSFNLGYNDRETDSIINKMTNNLKNIEKKINSSNKLKNGFHIQLEYMNNDDYALGFFLLYDKNARYDPS